MVKYQLEILLNFFLHDFLKFYKLFIFLSLSFPSLLLKKHNINIII